MENTCDSKYQTSKIGLCEVCASVEARYSCPRCELKTCSLVCVNIHKKEVTCSGERDKTGYIPLSKFSNLDLLSDYRFLEDISRAVDNCRRNPLKRYTRFQKSLPNHLHRLRSACIQRKTRLEYLPQHFTRHKVNTTYLNFKSQVIYWRIEFIFPQADHIKVIEERVDEGDTLSAIVSKYMDFSRCPEVYQSHLKFYHAAGLTDIELLLKAEQVKSNSKFYLLDLTSTLGENLENKTIIEYPIIYVTRKSFKHEYDILPDVEDSDFDIMKRPEKPTFTPYHYFDTVDEKRINHVTEKRNKIVSQIHSSAKALKHIIAGDSSSEKETETESEDFNIGKLKRKKLDIPNYEDL